MARSRILVVILTILVVTGLGFALHRNYPVLEAYYYNQNISVSSVQLYMTEAELIGGMDEKEEFVYGMGGDGWRFRENKLFVMTSSLGLFQDRVSSIRTENPSHRILGIKVGDDFDTTVNDLISRGFKELSRDLYSKGNIKIQLSGGIKIEAITIGIEDPSYKDVQF